MNRLFLYFSALSIVLVPAAFGGPAGHSHGHHHGHGEKPRVGDHGGVKGAKAQMNTDAFAASRLMNQMANQDRLQNIETRNELNAAIRRLNEGTKRITDLVNKEGYDQSSATKELGAYLQSFKTPDLTTLQNLKDPVDNDDFERGFKAGAAVQAPQPAMPSDPQDVQYLALLKENGYEPNEQNLAMLKEAAGETKPVSPSAPSQPSNATSANLAPQLNGNVQYAMNSSDDSKVNAIDHIGTEKEGVSDRAVRSLASAAPDQSEKSANEVVVSESPEISGEKLVTPEQAEITLMKQLGSKEEALAILGKLKKDSAGNPKKFSELFHQFQARHLAQHKVERSLASMLRPAVEKIFKIAPLENTEADEVPLAGWLAVALGLSTLMYYSSRALGARKKDLATRRFVIRNGEPGWADSLKKSATPHAPKSKRFQKAKQASKA